VADGSRLDRHLRTWLGRWPGDGSGLDVVAWPGREKPGWDGHVHPAVGVRNGDGDGVLSVPATAVARVRELVAGDDLLTGLPAAVGRPGGAAYAGVFRWTLDPAPLPDVGVWVPSVHAAVPDWLRVFGGEVLVVLDPETGGYLAGVGVKCHDAYGRELAVGTVERARGQGLARRLVAQAARRVLDDGAVPTYLHDPANVSSAKTADAAGFPDRGWTVLAVG
jgi:GNAT superfamily N-acetyltransferase